MAIRLCFEIFIVVKIYIPVKGYVVCYKAMQHQPNNTE